MKISELSVRRPVFAAVVSLLLVILGTLAAVRLPIREFPDVESPVISITTDYRGASSDVIETKITKPIEDQVAGLEGITKLTSVSRDEHSSVNIEFNVNRDLEAAANDVRDRVARVLANLPEEADPPQVSKQDAAADAIMFLNLRSPQRSSLELTDFAHRYLVDRFSVVPGVANVRVFNERRYAMRVWLDRAALAAHRLTVADLENALRSENVELPAGRIESRQREFTLRTVTRLKTPEDFRQLVVGRGADGSLVRLGEVAKVEVAAEDDRGFAHSDGLPSINLGIIPQSKANVIQTAAGVRAEMERIAANLPPDIKLTINVDFSIFVSASMREVRFTLTLALTMVLIVIFGFLGSWRATLIPAITIPVSIVASAIVMAAMGFSINVLTLLGIVLAIGLVVDDGIVVLENIVRRMERGEAPVLASISGSHEIGFAVLAVTTVLVTVFLPISFMPGRLGRLFGEFGISVAAAVGFSALIALTLVPMLSSILFAGSVERGRFAGWVDAQFNRLAAWYRRALTAAVRNARLVAVGAAAIAGLGLLLWQGVRTDYSPREDRGIVMTLISAPEGSSVAYTKQYVEQVEGFMLEEKKAGNVLRVLARSGAFGSNAANLGIVFTPLTPWDQRKKSANQIAAELQRKVANLPGVRVIVQQPPSLPVSGFGNNPVQVVLEGDDFNELARVRDRVLDRARAENPALVGIDSDYKERQPQMRVSIDRNKAADLGISLGNIGRTLETMLGSRNVTTYTDRGEEYNVILQASEEERASPADLDNIYVRSDRSGALVPLASLVTVQELAGPQDLRRFNRLRAITISAGLAPQYSLGEALSYLERVVREESPPNVRLEYDGESRELKEAGSALIWTFLMALVIVYLVLAAQFESFIHPFVILTTVPLAITGALVGLFVFNASVTVFSGIGAILLVGLAAKNGVLIVEFANQLRDRGHEFLNAVVEAAVVRLRPVLMTSLCSAFGSLPLMLATGAGAESRRALGAVVFFGVTISMVLTLFVVPAIYALIARNTRSPQYVSRMIDRLTAGTRAEVAQTPGN
jgi:multidrug efflux pump